MHIFDYDLNPVHSLSSISNLPRVDKYSPIDAIALGSRFSHIQSRMHPAVDTTV